MQTETYLRHGARQVTKKDLVEIYEHISPRLFRYAYRLLGDPDLAEDCVSESFSRFLSAIQRGFGPRENLQAYLYRVAHNWITDYYRSHVPQVTLEHGEMIAHPENAELKADQKMEDERVRQALLHLPEEQRQVIMLRFYEEWSHEEVAASIEKTVEATRALQYRALNGLRRLLIAD